MSAARTALVAEDEIQKADTAFGRPLVFKTPARKPFFMPHELVCWMGGGNSTCFTGCLSISQQCTENEQSVLGEDFRHGANVNWNSRIPTLREHSLSKAMSLAELRMLFCKWARMSLIEYGGHNFLKTASALAFFRLIIVLYVARVFLQKLLRITSTARGNHFKA